MQANKIITSTELDPMAKMRQELEELKTLRADLAKEKQADVEAKRIILTEDDLADVLVRVEAYKRPGSHDDVWMVTIRRDRFKASDVSSYFRTAYKLPLYSVFVKYQEGSHATSSRISGGPGGEGSLSGSSEDSDSSTELPTSPEGSDSTDSSTGNSPSHRTATAKSK